MRAPRFWWRLPLMAAYGFIGIVHLAAPDAFLPIMPGWVPEPRLTVIVTGLCELAGVLGLAWGPTRRWAGTRPRCSTSCPAMCSPRGWKTSPSAPST